MTAQDPPGPPGGQHPAGGNGAPWPAGPNASGGAGWAGHPGAPTQPGQPVPPAQPAAPGTLPRPYENAPQTAQGMIDSVTAQGLPPDYAPPAAPGGLVNPHGSAQGPAVAPPQQAPGQQPGQQAPGQQAPPPQHAPGQQPGQEATGQQAPGDGNANGQHPDLESVLTGGPKRRVVDTSSGRADGLERCPKCGSTDVVHRIDTSKLMCTFCRNEWNETSLEAKFGFDSPIDQLRGTLLGSGASNTPESSEAVVTLKCGACGAEVVVNTDEALQSRCHWCRNTLSVNQQLPNGAVPDGVLPFSITRDEAIKRIEEFVKARKFFAHPKFVKEFAPTEVVGVYLPYLTVDSNASVELEGQGEVLIRKRTVSTGTGNNRSTKTVYDADLYQLGRAFDILIDDIQLESSQQRADQDTSRNTNNIINAILPFDVKNAVTYNANYLRGYTSERRDMDVKHLMRAADEQALSIARARANESTRQYNRGIRWERESIAVHGTRWLALYVPVWLYSYYQERKNGPGLVHYVAVNGRNGETMGSVPVRQGRLIGISTLIGGVITAASVVVVAGAVIGGALW